MRTKEQIDRICAVLSLDRRRKSILEWKRPQIPNQTALTNAALALTKLSDNQCVALLNNQNPIDSSRSLHF